MAVCESLERALKESISYVLERFDGVEKLSDEQTSGVLNFIQRKDVLAVLPTGSGIVVVFIAASPLVELCRPSAKNTRPNGQVFFNTE